ncbi:hypothetical protein M0812_26914 [Anaeramoeba flamelloides]|uniref:Uncharacterized protein n=1 Tax=Anaeramoeba flamelloides TaxID=1746091 RepID=A0AAV7YFE3_9EUKA|nr:hypothetical protein M0812_26914 [Anaeramoeba flamelloides]
MPDWHRIKIFFLGYGEEDDFHLYDTLWDYVNFYLGKVLNFILMRIIDPSYQFVESFHLPVPTLVVLFIFWSVIVLLLTFILDKTIGRFLRKKKEKKTKLAERPTVIIAGADNKQSMHLYDLLKSGEKSKGNVDLNEERDEEFALDLTSIEEITDLKKEMVEKKFQIVYLPFQKKSSIAQFAGVVDYVIFVTNQTAQIAYKSKPKEKGPKKGSKKNSQKENKRFDLMNTFFENKKLINRKPHFLVVSVDNENKVVPKLVNQEIKRNVPNSPKIDVVISSLQKNSINQVLFYLLGIN